MFNVMMGEKLVATTTTKVAADVIAGALASRMAEIVDGEPVGIVYAGEPKKSKKKTETNP